MGGEHAQGKFEKKWKGATRVLLKYFLDQDTSSGTLEEKGVKKRTKTNRREKRSNG